MISSAFVGSVFRVYSFFGVRSFSFTVLGSLFMAQYVACSLSWMNFSVSVVSVGMFSALFWVC